MNVFYFFVLFFFSLNAYSGLRIVALMPSIAEVIIDLNHESDLVGVPEYTNFSNSLMQKVKILGPYPQISPEAVYALHPNIVFASKDGNDAVTVQKLESLGIQSMVLENKNLQEVISSIKIIAKAISESNNKKISEFEKKVQELKKIRKLNNQKIFIQISEDPIMTSSKGTFIHDIIELSGGVNVFSNESARYPRITAESVIARKPDIIFIVRLDRQTAESEKVKKFWMQFENIPAIKTKKIYIIPADWITKPSFSLMKGIDFINQLSL